MLLGALGAPLSYAGAARAYHALAFVTPSWHGLLWLAAGWTIAMLVLVRIITPSSHTREAGD
jgi:hypothetical protein